MTVPQGFQGGVDNRLTHSPGRLSSDAMTKARFLGHIFKQLFFKVKTTAQFLRNDENLLKAR
jgi:hypothetical protein